MRPFRLFLDAMAPERARALACHDREGWLVVNVPMNQPVTRTRTLDESLEDLHSRQEHTPLRELTVMPTRAYADDGASAWRWCSEEREALDSLHEQEPDPFGECDLAAYGVWRSLALHGEILDTLADLAEVPA